MNRTTTEFVIRAGVFHGPALKLVGGAQNFERTLQSLNIPAAPEDTIDVSAYQKGLSDISRLADEDEFFLRAGLEQNVEEMGVYGQAIVSADTLWEALQIARTTMQYYQNDSELVIRVYRGRCRIWYFGPFQPKEAKQDILYTMGLLINVICLACSQTHPEISIAYPGGSQTHFQNNAAVNDVRSSQQGYIEFHEDLLRAKMCRSDSTRAEVLARYLNGRRVFKQTPLQTAEVVAGLVQASFGVSHWSLSDTSTTLRLGERSLQIRLKNEGTTFRRILQAERHKEARRLLRSGKNIDSVSEHLGFEHRQTFSEAFANWEGCPPSAYSTSSK